jgi:RNase P subunit RPR2
MNLPRPYVFIQEYALRCDSCGQLPFPSSDGAAVRVRRGEQFVCLLCAESLKHTCSCCGHVPRYPDAVSARRPCH